MILFDLKKGPILEKILEKIKRLYLMPSIFPENNTIYITIE